MVAQDTKTYYDILGVPQSAKISKIKDAYHKRSKELHPDKHVGKGKAAKDEATRKFQELQEAYETISDQEKREAYDREHFPELFQEEADDGEGAVDEPGKGEDNGEEDDDEAKQRWEETARFTREADEVTKRILQRVQQKKSPHAILGLLEFDEPHEARCAFRRLLVYVHPEHNKVSPNVSQAYNAVLDAAKKLNVKHIDKYVEEVQNHDPLNGELDCNSVIDAQGNWYDYMEPKADRVKGKTILHWHKTRKAIEEEGPNPEKMEQDYAAPTDKHKAVYKDLQSVIDKLLRGVDIDQAIDRLEAENKKLDEINTNCSKKSGDCNIPIEKFVDQYHRARVAWRSRVRTPDSDNATEIFRSVGTILRNTTAALQLPSEWGDVEKPGLREHFQKEATSGVPEETTAAPAPEERTSPPKNKTSASASQTQTKQTQEKTKRGKPKTVASAEQTGTVIDKGVEKTFEYWRALPGAYDKNRNPLRHQIMVSHIGPNGYTIYEFIKSSYFGKGVAQSWKETPGAKEFKTSSRSLLKDKRCREKEIAGVCPVKRTGPPPVYMVNGRKETGWLRKPVTYVYITFDSNSFHWFTISELRNHWGAAIDRDVEKFCHEAGQKLPGGHLMLRKAEYADDDDNEADGISLGAYSANEDASEEDDYDYEDDFIIDDRRRRSRVPPRARYRGESREMRDLKQRLARLEMREARNARSQNSTKTSKARNERAATMETDYEDHA